MLENWELILRLLLAAALGSVIGIDRERLVWAAGLRTHMLVSVGACLFMVVSAYGFNDVLGPHIVLDPSRVAAQVVSGIGFLGAGSILLRGEVVRGLTTAASLWTVAAIGLAVGRGLYIEAIAATVIILIILAGIKPLETRLLGRNRTHELRIEAEHGRLSLDALSQMLGYRATRITRYTTEPVDETGIDRISLTLGRLTTEDISEIILKLTAEPYVRSVTQKPRT